MTAIEKFVEAMNKTSEFWKHEIIVTGKNGELTMIEYNGFTFISDKEEK